MIDIEPRGMTDDDLAAIVAQLACTAPGATGFLWHYSETTRILLVGSVHDRRLVQWLMQPAPTEQEAQRAAGNWAAMLGNAANAIAAHEATQGRAQAH